jgi:FixJ family two-component response regulator
MPLIPPLRDLTPEELDVLQLAFNYGHVETVLNKSLATDLETSEILVKLLKAGYLKAE